MKSCIFTIEKTHDLTERVFALRLVGDTSGIERPGQFAALSVPGFFLRRPFSVCDWDETGLSLVIEQVGEGTRRLRQMAPGTPVDLLCGLGNGFALDRAGERPLLVGGGSGAAPMLGLARRLREQGCAPQIILGFNSREDILLLDDFYRIGLSPTVTTVNGSFGIRGFVTAAMDLPHSFFYACGPEAMLRAVSETSPGDGQMSFDARMGCGFGACMGCTRITRSGPKRVCKDGPVFDKEEIVWDA